MLSMYHCSILLMPVRGAPPFFSSDRVAEVEGQQLQTRRQLQQRWASGCGCCCVHIGISRCHFD